jgi:hypothetical protein
MDVFLPAVAAGVARLPERIPAIFTTLLASGAGIR